MLPTLPCMVLVKAVHGGTAAFWLARLPNPYCSAPVHNFGAYVTIKYVASSIVPSTFL